MSNILENIASGLHTDKLEHGYLPYYEKHLPKNIKYLLEIGAYKGESLRLWDKYYSYNANIHTVDLFEHEENITERWCLQNNYVPFKGSQSDVNLLDRLPRNTYDVIIEDGSHNSSDQIISMAYCFEHNLKSGGLWVTEDLHCCNENFYWGNGVESFEDTLLSYFITRNFIPKNVKRESLLSKIEDISHLFGDIKLYDSKILFITKK
jgi:hypothetical protein